jgi:hypothetical protein
MGLPTAKPHTVCGRSTEKDQGLPARHRRSQLSWVW